ncbi:MAG: metallophosphoesterase [Candidatus Moranbacteria bacterium]|nr:metallophosphoesterase [Candidatus Moranbacteria bacterium]
MNRQRRKLLLRWEGISTIWSHGFGSVGRFAGGRNLCENEILGHERTPDYFFDVMKIAVISDIHDNTHNLVLAFGDIRERGVGKIFFLGDFINNGIARMLAAASIPVFAIFGNNDGDKAALTRTSLSEGSSLTLSENVYHILEEDGKRIFLSHYPDIALSMARSGDFDAVFYGHNHDRHEERVGECLLANPGEISAHKTGTATYFVYDTERNEITFVELEGIVSVRTDIVDEYSKEADLGPGKKPGHHLRPS